MKQHHRNFSTHWAHFISSWTSSPFCWRGSEERKKEEKKSIIQVLFFFDKGMCCVFFFFLFNYCCALRGLAGAPEGPAPPGRPLDSSGRFITPAMVFKTIIKSKGTKMYHWKKAGEKFHSFLSFFLGRCVHILQRILDRLVPFPLVLVLGEDFRVGFCNENEISNFHK